MEITRLAKPIQFIDPEKLKKKVAAYARVSRDYERLEHSLGAQVSYYRNYIENMPGWIYAGIYVDDGITGVNTEERDGFRQMMEDCEAGKIDIILTKSIARFSRNTVDCLKALRRLGELHVEVRFERENINTTSMEREFTITMLATFAQEESRSISENLRWAVQKKYQAGISLNHWCYGYRWNGKELLPEPTEAKVVERIFREFLEGIPMPKIAAGLNKDGYKTLRGGPFCAMSIRHIITNERYVGDLILQKSFSTDFPEMKTVRNRGERLQFYVQDDHPAIISREDFALAQKELERRRNLDTYELRNVTRYPFSQKVRCSCCGKTFHRFDKRPYGFSWRCPDNKSHGGIGINEKHLEELAATVMGMEEFDAETFDNLIDHIESDCNGDYRFIFKDGTEKTCHFIPQKKKENKDA